MKNKFIAFSEYMLSFLLLSVYLVNYISRINSTLFFLMGSVLFVLLFAVCIYKSNSFIVACIMMLCHTWQISWFNVFGQPTGYLQLPWFYVLGFLIVIHALFNFKKIYTQLVNLGFLANIIFVLMISVIPLFLSPSKSSALKEYIMIMFYVLVVFAAFLLCDTEKFESREIIFNSYIWCAFISCFFLIFQAVVFYTLGISLFYQSEGTYFGNTIITSGLLMKDLSSATIMLGSAVFVCLSRMEKKKNVMINVAAIIVIIVGIAFTSRRTSTISLMIVLVLYALFHVKGMSKKLLTIGGFALLCGIMVFFFLYSRPVDNMEQFFFENGRIKNYIKVFETVKDHPFGVSFDAVYNSRFMSDGIQPHNTFLRWLFMGGPLFAVPMLIIPVYVLVKAYKKKFTAEFWIILYSLLASNFIPDILSARFFIIPCICVLFIQPLETNEPKLLKSQIWQK